MNEKPVYRPTLATLLAALCISIGIACVVVLIVWVALAASGAKPCTHGASSIQAVRGADGKLHVSKPHATGCVKP